MVGGLPGFRQQDAVHGLPLQLSPEEVTLAVDEGWVERELDAAPDPPRARERAAAKDPRRRRRQNRRHTLARTELDRRGGPGQENQRRASCRRLRTKTTNRRPITSAIARRDRIVVVVVALDVASHARASVRRAVFFDMHARG